MSDNGHILIVDDQKDVCDVVEEYLSGEGYRVSTAQNGDEMRRVLAQDQVDLVVLDLTLPGEDGLALARFLRSESQVGIVIVTGRGELVDRIIGLEMGADDYLPKPFNLRELLARVKSVLRRIQGTAEARAVAAGPRSRVRFSGWEFDLGSRELTSPAGEQVRLTTGEYDLLAVFVANANQVLSRTRLLDLARNREAGPFDRTIDVQVGRLRRKIEEDPQNPTMIKTVRGGGYTFSPTVESV